MIVVRFVQAFVVFCLLLAEVPAVVADGNSSVTAEPTEVPTSPPEKVTAVKAEPTEVTTESPIETLTEITTEPTVNRVTN